MSAQLGTVFQCVKLQNLEILIIINNDIKSGLYGQLMIQSTLNQDQFKLKYSSFVLHKLLKLKEAKVT